MGTWCSGNTRASNTLDGRSIRPDLAKRMTNEDWSPSLATDIFDSLVWIKEGRNGLFWVGANKMDCAGTYWEPVTKEEAFRSVRAIVDLLAQIYPDLSDGELDDLLLENSPTADFNGPIFDGRVL